MKFTEVLKKYYYYLYEYQRRTLDAFRYRKRIKRTIQTYPAFALVKKNKEYLKKSKQFLSENLRGYKNTNYHHFYYILGNSTKIEYIPCEFFFTSIEPVLNDLRLANAIADKLSSDLFFEKSDLPETLFKIVNKMYYDNENNSIAKSDAIDRLKTMNEIVVLKPGIFSGAGKNVYIDTAEKIANIILKNPKHLKGSFLIQKAVKQHPNLAKFHPSSLNTIRVMTARVNSDIVILSAYLKIGGKNNRNDNITTGGLIININEKGELADVAFTREKIKVDRHPDTGVIFGGNSIPNYNKVKRFCIKNHKRFLRFTFISWDIGINEKGNPVFIEFNLRKQAIHGHQILNGPLFGKHTEYFINRYNEERKEDNFFN